MPVIMFGSEPMIWKEEERSKISAVQMDKIRSLLGIRRMDRIPYARIKSCAEWMKGWRKKI